MKKYMLLCLSLALCVSMVACGEKTDGDIEILNESQENSSTIISDEDLITEVAKRYMTAVEQNDTHTMADCMDPNLQGTVEGTADILGNLLGVGDVADTAQYAQGYFAQSTLESMGLTLNYTYAGLEGSPVVNENDATITLVYDLFATDGTKEISAPLIAEFELLKMGEDWYLKAEPVVSIDEESLAMTNNGEVVTSFGTGAFTDEYELDTQPSYDSLESEYMYAFSQGYAIVELSSIQNQDMKDFMAIIDESGVIQGTISDDYAVRSSVHDGALLVYDSEMYALLSIDGSVFYEFPEGTKVVSRESTIPYLYVHITETSYEGDTIKVGLMDYAGNWLVEPMEKSAYLAMLPEDVDTSRIQTNSYNSKEEVDLTYINETMYLVDFAEYYLGQMNTNEFSSLRCIKKTDSDILVVDNLGSYTKVFDNYFSNDASVLYYRGTRNFGDLYKFDLLTGINEKLSDDEFLLEGNVEYGLALWEGKGYCDLNTLEVIIDFDKYPTMQDKSDMVSFQYGYVPIIMNGYYTLLDTQGDFAFEPKQINPKGYSYLSWMKMISENAFLNLNHDTIESTNGEILYEIPKDYDVKITNDGTILLQSDNELIYIDEYGVPLF